MATERKSGIWIPEEVETWPVDFLLPCAWNPNSQSGKVFNRLVESIREDGFLEPIITAPVPEDNFEEYVPEERRAGYLESPEAFRLIVGGKHRWDAAKVLDMGEAPIVHKADANEDWIKLRNMSLNTLRGKIDPERFQRLYMDMLDKGYEEEILQYQMGLVEDQAFKSLIKDIKSDMPEQMQRELADAEDGINSLDDLDRVLNEIMSKCGDTLESDFVSFDYGGRTVQWVQMDRPLFKIVTDLAEWCYSNHLSINRVYEHLLKEAKERVLEAKEELLLTADEEMEEMFD